MERKQIKAMFFILTMITALVCHHQSEAISFIGRLKCVLDIRSVEGCVDAIKKATKGDSRGLDKECCDAISGLTNDCLPIIFSGGPAIGLLEQNTNGYDKLADLRADVCVVALLVRNTMRAVFCAINCISKSWFQGHEREFRTQNPNSSQLRKTHTQEQIMFLKKIQEQEDKLVFKEDKWAR
ncbi:hypothetical protein YC2023_021292 [Brassica napus]